MKGKAHHCQSGKYKEGCLEEKNEGCFVSSTPAHFKHGTFLIQGCQVGNKIPLVLTVVDEACTEFGLIETHGEIGDVCGKGSGDNCCLWANVGKRTEGKVLKLGRAIA